VEETLVLHDRAAAASYRFLLDVPAGITADHLADGRWAFRVPGRAEPTFYLTDPVAYDSSSHHGLDPTNHHARIDVSRAGEGFQIDLSIDRGWLTDPGRSFPVLLDPTISIQPDSNDASFIANCSNCTPWLGSADGRMAVGTDNQYVWREAIQFNLNAIPAGAIIQSASLGVYWDGWCLAWTGSGYACAGRSYQIDVHRMTAAWSATSTTSQVQYDSPVLSSYTLSASQAYGWMNWDVGGTVRNWYSGAQPNYGLYMMLNSEPLSASGPYPPGMRYTASSSLTPELNVTYLNDAVTLNQPSLVHSNGAELNWSGYTGPSGAPFQKYEVHRSPTPNFAPTSSTLLTATSDISVTSYRDTTAAPNTTFYYAVVANSSKSNEVRISLPADGLANIALEPGASDGPAAYVSYYTGFVNCANYGSDPNLWVGSDASDVFRTLLQFNLASVPAGATGISAQLGLWQLYSNANAQTVQAFPVTSSWKEGSGAGTCTGDGATWYATRGRNELDDGRWGL